MLRANCVLATEPTANERKTWETYFRHLLLSRTPTTAAILTLQCCRCVVRKINFKNAPLLKRFLKHFIKLPSYVSCRKLFICLKIILDTHYKISACCKRICNKRIFAIFLNELLWKLILNFSKFYFFDFFFFFPHFV